MKKRILSLLMCLCLSASLLPGTALAAETPQAATEVVIYTKYEPSTEVTLNEATPYYVSGAATAPGPEETEPTGWTAKFTPATEGKAATLTLNSLDLTGMIIIRGDITLDLIGDNTICGGATVLNVEGSLTVTGNGKISLVAAVDLNGSNTATALGVGNSLTVESGTIIADASQPYGVAKFGGSGIGVEKSLTVCGGSVTGKGYYDENRNTGAFWGVGASTISVSGGSVTGIGTGESCAGIVCNGQDANMTITGGEVTGTSTGLYGVEVNGTATVSGNGKLTGTGNECGIESKNITVNGGTVVGEATMEYVPQQGRHLVGGITAQNTLHVTNGTVTGTSGGYGVKTDQFSVAGGKVTGTGGFYPGIYPNTLTITGGDVSGESTHPVPGMGGVVIQTFSMSGGSLIGKSTRPAGEDENVLHPGIYINETSSIDCTYTYKLSENGDTITGPKSIDDTVKKAWGMALYCCIKTGAAATHTWDTEWTHNETSHWHACSDEGCSEKTGTAAHVYNDCMTPKCTVCGYEGEGSIHSWDTEWATDATHHWHNCTVSTCPITENSEKDGYAAHVYDNDQDTTCNTCGYTRTVSGGNSSSSSSGSNNNTTTPDKPVTNPDGSTTTTTEDKTTGTVTETTKKPDGSQTVVETKKDGTVTTKDTDKDGNKTETVAKPDGSSVTKVEQTDGTTASVSTDTSGKVEAEVALPAAVVDEAQKAEKPVALPIPEVKATTNANTAPVVTVKTGSADPVKVEIPTADVTPGTVAVIVNADGSEEVIKTSVPTENGLTVALPDGATVKIVDNSKSFADVPTDSWAADAVNFSASRELFSGTGVDSFSPEEPMTRAMLMTVLARFDGEDTSGGDTWYEKGMDWAVANGVSDGSAPDGNISREQLAVMLWRYSGSPAPSGSLDGFTDGDAVSGYAQEAMLWAVENGVVSGFGDGTLGPQGQATRAQVAQMMKNFIMK